MKNYFIFGLGISGISSARYLSAKGQNIIAWDDNEKSRQKLKDLNLKNIEFKKPNNCDFSTIDALVLSPGIALTNPVPHYIVDLARGKCPIICDVELLYSNNQNANFIGITGTNGKSTTTSLIGHLLKSSKLTCEIGGNIGTPVLNLPEYSQNNENYIVEMSSFQLDLIDKTKFNIAIWTNISPDHLDRHGDIAGYVKAKSRIFANQSKNDVAIIGIDDQESLQVYKNLKTQSKATIISISNNNVNADICVKDNIIYDNLYGKKHKLLQMNNLQGVHNAQNIACAYGLAKILNISDENILNYLKTFKGLPHRMQYICNSDGISYVNDSKATNANSTYYALDAFKNIHWIAGGIAKDGGIDNLQALFKNVTKAYLIGESAHDFANILEQNNVNYQISGTLEKAFLAAKSDAKELKSANPTILLSPACASFDQFKNFEERGETFYKLTVN